MSSESNINEADDKARLGKKAKRAIARWDGIKSTVTFLNNNNTKIIDFDLHKKYIRINFIHNHKSYYCNSTNKKWIHQIELQ